MHVKLQKREFKWKRDHWSYVYAGFWVYVFSTNALYSIKTILEGMGGKSREWLLINCLQLIEAVNTYQVPWWMLQNSETQSQKVSIHLYWMCTQNQHFCHMRNSGKFVVFILVLIDINFYQWSVVWHPPYSSELHLGRMYTLCEIKYHY